MRDKFECDNPNGPDYDVDEEELNEEELNEDEIVQVILEMGNDILKNLGVEERIHDVGVFFSDAFYIQFFQAAFPEIDFNQLEEATNEEEMASNIQMLINLLGQQILKYDLSHIRGEEIVNGNPEHCINLLQLVQEISVMLQNKAEGATTQQLEDDDDDDYDEDQPGSGGRVELEEVEDDEAILIHERKRKLNDESPSQISQQQPQQRRESASNQKQTSKKKGRSYSDDLGKPQFEMDELEISNKFDVLRDNDDEDEDEDEAHFREHLLQQEKRHNKQQQQQQQFDQQEEEDDMGEPSYNEEIDDDDLKMYEQFLANNKDQEQQLAMIGQQNVAQEPDSVNDNDQFDEEDLDNIDYEQLDPQILEIAEQMGVHPKEVLKQWMQLQSQEGYGDEEDDPDQQEDEEEEDLEEKLAMEEQLRKEKELFKQQMGLSNKPKDASPQPQKQQVQSQQPQKQQVQQHQFYQQEEEDDEDQESYYSEGEIKTKIKLLSKKSYSAPYIIINDCFDEPLYDDESQHKAYSTTILQSVDLQDQLGEGEGMDGEELDEQTAMLLYQQQQKMISQQQQQLQQQQQNIHKPNQSSKITEVSKSKESSSYGGQQPPQNRHLPAQNMMAQNDDYDEEEEMDIDMSQKLQELQQLDDPKVNQNQHQMDDGEDGEDEEDDDMLIDLDQLDDHSRQMLLQYLHQEYQKNPDQFPFPKELIEDYMIKQQQQQSNNNNDPEQESVKDIKSEEMIVEDINRHVEQIEGGEQEVENEGDNENEEQELTEEQQIQLQQMIQDRQNNMDYGDEGVYEDETNMMQPQFQQQMMSQKPPKSQAKGKGKRPKSAGKKKKANPAQQQVLYQEPQLDQIPPEQLQQLAQLLQEQQIDIENVDPNLLQQMIIAQSQYQQAAPQRQSRPATGKKRRTSAQKKKNPLAQTKTSGLSKLQPYQMPKSIKVLHPSTPGNHFKSFNTQRSQPFSKKKPKKKSSQKSKKNTIDYSQQQMYLQQPIYQQQFQDQVQIDPNFEQQNEEIDPNLLQQQQQQLVEIPNLSEEFLNQLSEEQLELLLQHQQELMLMQQQQINQNDDIVKPQLAKKTSRPKSAKTQKSVKSNKIPQSYSNYYQPNAGQKRRASKGKKKGTKKKKAIIPGGIPINQGLMLNNYFPALESGPGFIGNSQQTEDGGASFQRDQKYPKFGTDNINNPQQLMGLQQEQIDEVPPEQEEGESQENIQGQPTNFYRPNQQNMGMLGYEEGNTDEDQMNELRQMEQDQDEVIQDQDVDQDQADPNQNEIELTDEQLIELIQNAHNLNPEQQAQLQMILQQRMKQGVANDRAQSYENIYHILMDNVKKAKDKLAPIGQLRSRIGDVEETDQRIIRQKQEFEALYRQYQNEMKSRETKKKIENDKVQRKVQRETKIQAIKERKFQEELISHQKSLNYKRNAQQVKLCQKVYKLASELEKNKLLNEKKEFKENLEKKKMQNKLMVDAIETYYKNQIQMLKEKIESERFERKIAQQAQVQALNKMKRELNFQKKLEVEKYLQLLKQEDQKYDFESTNLQKLEQEILKMYKK